MKYIIRIILAFITVIILFLIVCVGLYVAKVDIDLFGFTIFTASGNSMNPTIENGDILLVSHQHSYNTKDIIVYRNDEGLTICHRIIENKGLYYVTKGDSNNFTDGYNPDVEDIYGKVIFNIVNVQDIIKYKYVIMGIVLGIPLLLLLIKWGRNVRRNNHRVSS